MGREGRDALSSVAPPPADKAVSYFPLSPSEMVSEIEEEYQKVGWSLILSSGLTSVLDHLADVPPSERPIPL